MKPLTKQDINRYRNDIEQNHVQGVVRTYADLLSKGYNYAGWAKGVAEAEGMTWGSLPKGETTGRAAVMFMKDSSGQTFTEQKLNRIREGMAVGYLDFLESRLGESPRDVNFKEMRRFHEKVFVDNGLSINNWTLETPMKLIGKYEGERRQEEIWQKLLATRGSGLGALTESATLYQAVEDYAQGHIYFDKKGERIENTKVEDNDGTPVMTVNVRRISEADRMEAAKWIRNVSRFKPLLFSEAEQAQEMQYAAAAKQDDFLSATNDLITRLKSGDQAALSDFMGRDDVRQMQRESAMTAQAFLSRNPGYGEEMLPNRFQRLEMEDMSDRFRNLYKDSREQLAGYYQEQGIRYREEALDNTAAALAAAGCRSRMKCVSMISVADGQVNIGDESFPDFRTASVNARNASLTGMQESMESAQRTEREFEEQARQREMERMAQSHSRGMSIG
jgi:hemolysin-type calcium-binding protein